jgi:DNA repair protein RadC
MPMPVRKSLPRTGRPDDDGERMHLTQVVFLATMIAALTAALSRGGLHERVGAALLFVAAMVTPMVQRHLFNKVETGIAIVDLLLFGALLWMALTSNRRWPVYAAAFQALGVLTHLARLKAGPVNGDSYGHLLVAWSYLVTMSLLLGSLIEPRESTEGGRPEIAEPPTPPLQPHTVPKARKQRATDHDDHALLARLLALHGLGSASDGISAELLERSGSFAAAIATPASRIADWGLDRRVQDTLALARSTTQITLKRRLETRPCLADQKHVIDYLHAELAHLPVEQFRVLYLNVRQRLIHEEIHGQGTVNAAAVFPREIVKRALEVGAVEIILAHNHPGGDPTASRSDIQVTRASIEAVCPIDVRVVDHIVIGFSGHISMRATGLI